MDVFGDHALARAGGGDRTKRHNLLRNQVAMLAAKAGLQPELEKGGLLPQRPPGELPEGVATAASHRRPADVWLPSWRHGLPAALDLAATSGLSQDNLRAATQTADLPCEKYAQKKRAFDETAKRCEKEGFSVLPLVVESHGGGWDE